MTDQGTVNHQIVDSVADVVTLNSGHAPAHAFGMLDTVMTDTLGMTMYNAVSRQQGASMIGSAAVTAACARMVSVPFPVVVAPPPEPPPPPAVDPLPPPPPDPMPSSAIIAAATAQAEAAIATLKFEADQASADAEEVSLSLAQIAEDAVPPPPPPPSSPPQAF